MPISDILELAQGHLTPQQVADFALVEDRAVRAAMRRGDDCAAQEHLRERDRLCDWLNNLGRG